MPIPAVEAFDAAWVQPLGPELRRHALDDPGGIKVLVRGSSNAVMVGRVTADRAYEIAEDMGAAWGRRLPEPMHDRQTWAATLDEQGSFSLDDDSMVVEVERSTNKPS